MPSKTFEQVKHILVERFSIDAAKIQPESHFHNDLNMDSLDAIDFLSAVNETFKIYIATTELDDIHTVQQMVEVVEKKSPRFADANRPPFSKGVKD